MGGEPYQHRYRWTVEGHRRALHRAPARNVMVDPASMHACAVLVGARAILIRGPAGSGKSRLALALIEVAGSGHLRFARLVADDRVQLDACHGRLLARAPQTLAGLIEV